MEKERVSKMQPVKHLPNYGDKSPEEIIDSLKVSPKIGFLGGLK